MKAINNNILQIISILILLAVSFTGMSNDLKPFSYWLILIINVFMLWCTRKNLMMFIIVMVMAYSNYSIIYANFINYIDNTMYTQTITNSISNRALNILLIFNLSLIIFIDWTKIHAMKKVNLFHEKKRKDNIVLAIMTMVLIIVFFVGFKLPDVSGERGAPQPIYEYAVSFFIVYFYYSRGNKKNILWGIFLVTLYSLQNFMFGGRIYGLQFILVAFLMLLAHKFTIRKLLIVTFPFFVIFNIIGILRGYFLTHLGDLGDFGDTIFQSGFSLDTAYSAYYTSQAIVFASDNFNLSEKMIFFGDFIVSIFLGESRNTKSIPQNIAYQYIPHSFGCLMPHYFYFYFGTLGAIMAAFILKFYLRIIYNLKESTPGYIKCIAVFIVAHSFRWYLYSPLGLFRGVLFLTIVYFSMYAVHLCFTKRKALV